MVTRGRCKRRSRVNAFTAGSCVRSLFAASAKKNEVSAKAGSNAINGPVDLGIGYFSYRAFEAVFFHTQQGIIR